MVPVLLPCPLHRRSPSFSASGSAPFGTGTQCSSRFIGARPWLTRALLPAASGSLFCSVPLGAPMYRSCQGRGRDAEDGSWDVHCHDVAPVEALRVRPRLRPGQGSSRGRCAHPVGCSFEAVPPVAPDCVIRRRGGEVPVGHELQAVRDAGLHYGLDKVAGLVRGLRSCLLSTSRRGRTRRPRRPGPHRSPSGSPSRTPCPAPPSSREEGIVEDQPVQRRLDTALRQPALELELVGEAVTGDCPRPAAPEYVPVELDVPLGMYRGFLNSFASSRTALKTWRASSVEQPGARSGGQWSASRPPPAG
eukprot:tig00000025_g7966.t3